MLGGRLQLDRLHVNLFRRREHITGQLAMTCLATNMCLCAIGLAVSAGVAHGGAIVMVGMLVAYKFGDILGPLPSRGVSAAGFAAFPSFRDIAKDADLSGPRWQPYTFVVPPPPIWHRYRAVYLARPCGSGSSVPVGLPIAASPR